MKKFLMVAAILAVVFALSPASEAGCFGGRRAARRAARQQACQGYTYSGYQATYYQATVTPTPQATPQAAPQASLDLQAAYAVTVTATQGADYGFTSWLNGVRAQYGLPPVGYDPNLSAWAASNNVQQQSYGMGHHVMGAARRQNSAMGNFASIGAMWLASPAHRAALLDPTIRRIGIAGLGAYWTFNAN